MPLLQSPAYYHRHIHKCTPDDSGSHISLIFQSWHHWLPRSVHRRKYYSSLPSLPVFLPALLQTGRAPCRLLLQYFLQYLHSQWLPAVLTDTYKLQSGYNMHKSASCGSFSSLQAVRYSHLFPVLLANPSYIPIHMHRTARVRILLHPIL